MNQVNPPTPEEKLARIPPEIANVAVVLDVELRRVLAAYSHDVAWAGWMRYMFSQGTLNPDGSWSMPPELVARWTQQMNTPFADLTLPMQVSDFEQADIILKTLSAYLSDFFAPPNAETPTNKE